ncbi:MAG: hypothetical protein MJ009_02270 [Paludibacteraceae bacterium]|nr:hypothetical protein [Paludibacteraceae bacterium]
MHASEWPREFLVRQEVEIRNNTVYVKDERGYEQSLADDSGIVDAKWVANAVIITYKNGTKTRYWGPYGSQRETY